MLLKDGLRSLKAEMDYSKHGGAVLFGLKAPVIKTHGATGPDAVRYTIRQIHTMLETDVVISNHFEIDTDKVTDELNIKDDLKADSISIMEFVLELEDEFGTEISDEDAEQIETVGGAVDYISSHLK